MSSRFASNKESLSKFYGIRHDRGRILIRMCPNCVLNSAAALAYIGPGLLCVLFFAIAGYFLYQAKQEGLFEGDEEEAKYGVFED